MNRRLLLTRSIATSAVVATFLTGLSTTPRVADAAEEACAIDDVDYALSARLLIKDTQFGAADGVYQLGAGTARVRFERGADGASKTAKLMSYDLDTRLLVKASFAVWSTEVVTETRTTAAHSCDGAAQGAVEHGDVIWRTTVEGYRSDGTIHCSGNVCGVFGAPPPGSSPLHEVDTVHFSPFHFAPDGTTFTMGYTRISHSDSPRQTSFLALSGREVRRTCVPEPLACQ